MPARRGAAATVRLGRGRSGFDIILLCGQSNMAGHGVRGVQDVNQTGVYQYGGDPADPTSYQKISASITPLGNPDGVTVANNYVGPGEYIGRTYNANTGRKVLLVPTAWGGTGLANAPYEWSSGGSGARFEFAISQALAALSAAKALDVTSRIVGICWIQGENDGAANVSESTYLTALQATIAGFRSRLSVPNAWFVMGGMVPEVIDANPTLSYEQIDMAHGEAARLGTNVGFVRGPTGFTTDNLHYVIGGVRTIGTAMGNVASAAIGSITTPSQFTFTDVSVAAGTLSVSNKITIAGLSPGRSVLVGASGSGVAYRKNSHTWRTDANNAVNGDTFELENTSGAAGSTVNSTLTVGGVSDIYTLTVPASGSPTQFNFTAQSDITAGATATSNTITIAGLGSGVTGNVSVTGGSYIKNGGTAATANTTCVDGDTFAVQGVANATAGGTTSVTLTVGATSSTFVITTAAASYQAESVTYFNAMSVAPSTTDKTNYDNLIAGLKTDGIWAKLDWLYILAAHDSQAALLNVKSPGSFTLSAVGSPTFTAYQGYTGTGGTCYLDTGWNASTNGVNFTQNSASIGAYVRSSVQGTVGCMGTRLSSDINLNPYNASGVMALRLNSVSAVSTTAVAAKGLKAINRASSTQIVGYQSGTGLGNQGLTSTAVTANTICLLGVNSAFAAHQLGFAFAGGSLTATDHANLNTRVNTYLTAVGGL